MNGPQVVILSADQVRSSLVQKVLQQRGLAVRLFRSYSGAKDSFSEYIPKVIVFDAKSFFITEPSLPAKIQQNLPGATLVVLADAAAFPMLEAHGIDQEFCFADPLDLELIADKVREAATSKKESRIPRKEHLVNDLKRFLKLD